MGFVDLPEKHLRHEAGSGRRVSLKGFTDSFHGRSALGGALSSALSRVVKPLF